MLQGSFQLMDLARGRRGLAVASRMNQIVIKFSGVRTFFFCWSMPLCRVLWFLLNKLLTQ